MDTERALEINEKVTGWIRRFHLGEDPGPIPEFDLADALEAVKIVGSYPGTRNPDGSVHHPMTSDPRVVAALFTLAKFPAADTSQPIQPILAGAGRAVVVIRLPQNIFKQEVRTCRVCGCTDDDCSQCVEAQGHPCHWVEHDLCSRCAAHLATPTAPGAVAGPGSGSGGVR